MAGQKTVKTPDGRTVVVLPGETDNQAIARAAQAPGVEGMSRQKTRVIVGPGGELIVAQPGESDAQALAAYRGKPRLGLLGAQQPEMEYAATSPRQGAATVLKGLGLGASMAIPGVGIPATVARGLITGGFGAGANELEGDSPLIGFLLNQFPEMIGSGIAANAARGGVRTALKMSGLNQTEAERNKAIEAFMREADRSRKVGQKPIKVGQQGVPATRLEEVGASMRGKEQASPYKPTVATMVERPQLGPVPQGQPPLASSTVGKDMQTKTAASLDPGKLDRTLDNVERRFLASQVYKRGKDIYQHLGIAEDDFMRLPDDELMKWARSTDMKAEDFGDLTRALKRDARPIIRSRAAGEYVPPAQAIREGDYQSQLATQGQEALKTNIPGLEADLNRYGDLAQIEGINDAIRETLGKASVRGGMAGAQGGAVAGRAGGLLGGLAGMIASPKNISGAGFKLGRVFEPNRMLNPMNIARTGDITDDFVRGLMALMYSPRDEER